mgnify:CR=1 FL=1
MGCVMVAHVYAVSMEMALITLMMILVVAVLYTLQAGRQLAYGTYAPCVLV